jgi:hypothetical protein
MMTLPDEITVTWWCCRCNKTGRLVFCNQNTIGKRLEVARGDQRFNLQTASSIGIRCMCGRISRSSRRIAAQEAWPKRHVSAH